MTLGLDMEEFSRLPEAQRQAVSDFVIRHGFPRAVRYELRAEGVLDVLVQVQDVGKFVVLRWGECGVSLVHLWRRGLRIDEVPPAIKEVQEMG